MLQPWRALKLVGRVELVGQVPPTPTPRASDAADVGEGGGQGPLL